MSLFSVYKEILPATGVDIAVTASFTSPRAVNLIIAKASILQIFNIVSEAAPETVKGNIIQHKIILKQEEQVKDDGEVPVIPLPHPSKTSRPRNAGRLELHSQHRLNGVITSIGVLRTTSPSGMMGMDSLLLSFRDAKMSLVEFSMSRQTLTTVSIHYFEREEFRQGAILERPDPEIRMDPQFRCAIMSFYGDKLAILPFKTDTSGATENDVDAKGNKNPVLPSFVIPMSSIDPQVKHVVDMVFLYNYFEPTLAILFEPVQTWTGRLAARRDTKCLIVISLDLSRKQYPVLYRSDHLPYNCEKITAVPAPVGGVIISSPNALIHVDQSSTPGVVLAVNGYYGMENESPQPPSIELGGPQTWILDNPLHQSVNISDYKKLGLSLDASQIHFLNPDTLLVVLRDGRLMNVQMQGHEDAGSGWSRKRSGVKKFKVADLGIRATPPSTVTRIGGRGGGLARALGCLGNGLGGVFEGPHGLVDYGHVFIGSQTGQSMLIQIWEADHHGLSTLIDDAADGVNDMDAQEDTKPHTSSNIPQKRKMETVVFDDEDEDLYGDSGTAHKQHSSSSSRHTNKTNGMASSHQTQLRNRFHFRLCDILAAVAPIRDMGIGAPATTSHSTTIPTPKTKYPYMPTNPRLDLEIVACVGEAPASGALAILHKGIRPDIVNSLSHIEGVNEVWSVKCASANKRRGEVEEEKAGETNGVAGTGDGSNGINAHHVNEFHKFMVLSKEDSTVVLEADAEFRELTDSGFYLDGPTVAVGSLLNDTVVIQIHPDGVNILNSAATLIQTMKMGDDNSWIVSASIADPYVMLLMNTSQVTLLKIDEHAHPQLSICKELKDVPIATASMYCDFHVIPGLPTQHDVLSHKSRYGLAASVDGGLLVNNINSNKGKGKKVVKLNQPKPSKKVAVSKPVSVKNEISDDDDDLYGDAPMTSSIAPVLSVKAELEEEDDLYNQTDDMDIDVIPTITEDSLAEMNAEALEDVIIEKRYWCVLFREDGSLEILKLPDFEQCFYMPRFDLLPDVISDHPNAVATPSADLHTAAEVSELLLLNLGRDGSHEDVYLVVRAEDGDIAMYKTFPVLPYEDMSEPVLQPNRMFKSPTSPSTSTTTIPPPINTDDTSIIQPHRLSIRLVRIQHEHLSREPRFYTDTDGDKLNMVDRPTKPPTFLKKHYLKPFTHVGPDNDLKYSGVFVAGTRPCWIFAGRSDAGFTNTGMQLLPQLDLVHKEDEPVDESILEMPLYKTGKRYPRIHPMICDGEISGMASMHHENSHGGFVYITKSQSIRIAQLPKTIEYDADWPHQRVPLANKTPHKIAYHSSSETFALLTSTPVAWYASKANYAAAIAGGVGEMPDDALDDDERAKRNPPVLDERDPALFLPEMGAYQLELVSPVTWETVDTYDFEEYEQVMCLDAVNIDSKQTASGKKQYLCCGTGFVRGEDNAGRGRLFVFDVIEVVPEFDNPQSNHKFKRAYVNEEKQPITAVRGVNGYLVAAVGTKIIIHTFEDGEELEGVAFIDTNIFVTSIATVKSLILVGDAYKSVWFLGFQEEPPKLLLLGKDYGSLQVYSCDFVVDNDSLGFAVADSDKNVMTFAYAPFNIQSFGGQRLIRKVDYHVGSHINKMIRLRRLPRPIQQDGDAVVSRQHGLLCGTLDGGLGMMVPVSDKQFKRMYALWSKLVNGLQHVAGLNPRGYRQGQSRGPPQGAAQILGGMTNTRSTMDGDLIWQFASLSVSQQREIAKSIGSSVERIMDDLLEIQHNAFLPSRAIVGIYALCKRRNFMIHQPIEHPDTDCGIGTDGRTKRNPPALDEGDPVGIVTGCVTVSSGSAYSLSVFDVILRSYPNSTIHNQTKGEYANEEKQPITAVRGVNGYLVVAVWTKIIIHTFEDGEELGRFAFTNTNIFVTSIAKVKGQTRGPPQRAAQNVGGITNTRSTMDGGVKGYLDAAVRTKRNDTRERSGGIGGFYGAFIHDHAKNILVSAVCRSNYEAVKTNGFKVTSPSFGDRLWKPHQVFANVDEASKSLPAGGYEHILVCSKALPELEDMPSMVEGLVTVGKTSIVLMQNGIGIEAPWVKQFPRNVVVSCMIATGATQTEPGMIWHRSDASITAMGVYTDENSRTNAAHSLTSLESLVGIMKGSGKLTIKTPTNVQDERWNKILVNGTFGPLSVVAGAIPSSQIATDPLLSVVAHENMKEIASVAKAVLGYPIPGMDLEKTLNNVTRVRGKSSFLVDWDRGIPMEVEVLLGNVSRLAKQHGVATPRVDMLYALLTKLRDNRLNSVKL
ncbi:2-dehydropantoate 2-reductase [Synchytrium microbalum]|uniref:2-dehydropantoate 2-reductase n=1 Tax=Synchytrium microbalum TaxID=1806994 RepID=A0A507C4H4_9FUNG|nr:2-dehydropantoate 2-reductase [Synchytrium microbalum]TPX33999.1 2-dehydropantoate 2-reductase [Synchytrium microbalum]